MTKNEAMWDRVARVAVGVALVAAARKGLIGRWGYMGIGPVITGSVGTCPGYLALGVSTLAKPNPWPKREWV